MMEVTAAHLTILATANTGEDGLIKRPSTMKSAAAGKIAERLIELGLVREIRTKAEMPIWRTDNEGKAYSLKILKAGRLTLQAAEAKAESSGTPADYAKRRAEVSPTDTLPCAKDAAPATKRAIVISLLQRREGATIADLMAATGWLAHTTRAALSGLRKTGVAVDRHRDHD